MEQTTDTLLDTKDAPADTTQGADKDTSLLDTKADASKDGDTSLADAKPDSKAEPADSKPEDTKPVVPESYDLKVPENMTLNPELKAEFDSVAKSLGLSQEAYQKIADLQFKSTEAQMSKTMESFNEQIKQWAEETKKELGADPAKSLAVASKAIDSIFTDPKENAAFREMMKTTGLGNWNLMVKAFTFVGKQLSEDKFVDGRPNTQQRKSTEEILFDHPTSVAAFKEAAQSK